MGYTYFISQFFRYLFRYLEGFTLFNLFFEGFLLFILIALVCNFADDNSLSDIATTVDSLKQTSESECKVTIN